MRIYTNHKLIRRNSRIGNICNIAGLIIALGGIYLSIKGFSGTLTYLQFSVFLVIVVIGIIVIQVGAYYGSRWGRSPRPDEIINKNMKGLGREHHMYHYLTPAYHLLVGPAGIWTIIPYHLAGRVTYEKKRWRLKGGGFIQSYLRLFGQEGLGRPDLEAHAEAEAVGRYLERILPVDSEAEIPPINSLLVFTNPNVELHVEDAPLPACKIKDLKDFLREKTKGKPITWESLEMVQASLPKPETDE